MPHHIASAVTQNCHEDNFGIFVAIGLLVSLWLKINLNTFKHLESECKCKISPDTFHIKYIIFQPNLTPPPSPHLTCARIKHEHTESAKRIFMSIFPTRRGGEKGHNNFIPWYSTIYKIIANRPATTGLRAALDISKPFHFYQKYTPWLFLGGYGALKNALVSPQRAMLPIQSGKTTG
jgi:hypothetical protein